MKKNITTTISFSGDEVTLLIYALRKHAFKGEHMELISRADKLEKKIIGKVVEQ